MARAFDSGRELNGKEQCRYLRGIQNVSDSQLLENPGSKSTYLRYILWMSNGLLITVKYRLPSLHLASCTLNP